MRSRLRCRLRCLHVLLVLLVATTIGHAPVGAQEATNAIGVYYVGPEDAIAHAIAIAAPYLIRVDHPDQAQVIVLNDTPLPDPVQAAYSDIQQGRTGLVLFCGPRFPQRAEGLRDLLGVSTFGIEAVATPADVRAASTYDLLQKAVTWHSAPRVRARTLINNPNLLRHVMTTEESGGIVQRVRGREQRQILIVGPWFANPSNERWTQWAYFDYLIYRLIADAANAARIFSFVDYPHSPTPMHLPRLGIAAAGMGLMLGIAAVYYRVRRYLFLNPDLVASWRRTDTHDPQAPDPATWDHVGFHRPLAGFLAFMPLCLLFLIPSIAYQITLLPDLLSQGSAGLETWTSVDRWTLTLWILLDAGTGIAAVRHFSARHRRFPQHALRYLQFYVWWQLLSGAVQVGIVCLLVGVALPATGLAHLSYTLLARALLQLPGFLGVFALAFRARQRFDHEQALNLLTLVSLPLMQTGLILILRSWGGAANEGLAVPLGLAGGAIFSSLLAFAAGVLLYRRENLHLSALFLPTFDRHTIIEVFRFGLPWAISTAIPALSLLVQHDLLGARLAPAELRPESWTFLLLVAAAFEIVLTGLYRDLMPMLTEALTLGTRTLLRYALGQGMRYGAWFSFFLFATLSALGKETLAGILSTRYGDAGPWLLPLLAWGALRWTVWLPDRMLEAAGKPGLMILLAFGEHAVRIGGALLLTPLWGMAGLLTAYFAGLVIRMALASFLMRRAFVEVRFSVWPTLLVPAGANLLLFYLLRGLQLLWQPTAEVTSGLLSIGLLLFALYVYAFLTALLGGWDDNSIAELERAATISGVGVPFAWLLLRCLRLGARVSPLHRRPSVTPSSTSASMLYDLAQKEARAATFTHTAHE